MSYTTRFRLADDFIAHVDTIITAIHDPFIISRQIGFVVLSAVTVYELAIKDILFDFADKKHRVLSTFTRAYFEQLNGRIKLATIRDDYLPRFGDKYVARFRKHLAHAEKDTLQSKHLSIMNCYANVIQWRHDFVHQGITPTNATYNEAKISFEIGKEAIHCLAKSMTR